MSGGLRLGSAGCFHGVHLEIEHNHCSVGVRVSNSWHLLSGAKLLVQLVMHS